jgi:hypothetical protein
VPQQASSMQSGTQPPPAQQQQQQQQQQAPLSEQKTETVQNAPATPADGSEEEYEVNTSLRWLYVCYIQQCCSTALCTAGCMPAAVTLCDILPTCSHLR